MHAELDAQRALQTIAAQYQREIVDELCAYVRIPAKSPAFDPDWQAHGYLDEAIEQMARWCRKQPMADMEVEVIRLPGRTPLLYIEIAGAIDDVVLLYGHMDKQPEFSGWSEGLGPWLPVIRDGKLYGRGGADDGYAVYGSLAAILALKAQGLAHAHLKVLIEGCEESGSYDLPHYVADLAPRLGRPSLVVCLDSGCGNYDQLWLTTSLRGLVGGRLRVEVLREGVHSGSASGVVPSSFRIARNLLSRLEDEATGRVLPSALTVAIPAERVAQAQAAAAILGPELWSMYPAIDGLQPMQTDLTELILNRTWRAALSVIGADGLPPGAAAGNVLLPHTDLKLSLRLPPTLDPAAAQAALTSLLEAHPPYGARVSFVSDHASAGWNAPALAPWLARSVDQASVESFGRPAGYIGEGGTIPFMAMLGASFPDAQFLITGVLGPHSNAHGPNEFLHLATAERVSAVVSRVIADHALASLAGQTHGAAQHTAPTSYDHHCC